MSPRYYDEWPRYPKTTRRAVEDGVKARKAGKGFATRWWAKKWLEALERIAGSSRLSRGRSYARSGQVMDYRVEAGGVTAKVQGSRRQPYDVRLSLRAFRDEEWAAALEALAAQAGFAAELLAGRMPEDVETAFDVAGVSLMPRAAVELKTSCSCPDWANPCKHVAAVHYILAEAFDDDPFLLFRLRGRGREQVLEELARLWGGPAVEEDAPVGAEEPLPTDPAAFWGRLAPMPALDFVEPPLWGAHLLAFGPPGPWAAPGDLREALEPALREAGQRARDAMAGEALGREEAPSGAVPAPDPPRARLAAPALLHFAEDTAVLIHLPAGPLQRFGPERRLALLGWLNRLPEVLCVRSEADVRRAFPTLDTPVSRLALPSDTVEGPRVRGATLDEALELLAGMRLQGSSEPLETQALALHRLWRYRSLHGYLPVLRRGQPRRCREEGAGEPDAALRDLLRRSLESLKPLRLLVDPPDLAMVTEAADPPLPRGLSRPEANLLRQAETLRLPDPLAGAAEFQPLDLDEDGFSGVWVAEGEDGSYHFVEVLDADASSQR